RPSHARQGPCSAPILSQSRGACPVLPICSLRQRNREGSDLLSRNLSTTVLRYGEGEDMLRVSTLLAALMLIVRSLAAAEAPASPPVDSRLDQKVTVALKAMALADVCDRLRAESGVALTAGPSVADDKVTLFCQELPLRDLMRELSRPFGYTWVRSSALNAQ